MNFQPCVGGTSLTERESMDGNQYITSYLVLPFLYIILSQIASELWINGPKMPFIQFLSLSHSTNILEGSTLDLGLGVRHQETLT